MTLRPGDPSMKMWPGGEFRRGRYRDAADDRFLMSALLNLPASFLTSPEFRVRREAQRDQASVNLGTWRNASGSSVESRSRSSRRSPGPAP
jgi:hypothetical protein